MTEFWCLNDFHVGKWVVGIYSISDSFFKIVPS